MSKKAILFAGQGCYFEKCNEDGGDLPDSVLRSPVARRFLKTCHSTLIAEYCCLTDRERSALGGNIDELLHSPRSIIYPPSSHHTNAVIQGISLFVRQILEYILHVENPGDQTSDIIEISGFCSGMISAIITSSVPSPRSPSFIPTAIAGFCLTFWAGLRSLIFCQARIENPGKDHPWSLVVLGMSEDEIQSALAGNESHQSKTPIRISAIVSKDIISLSGEGIALEEFRRNHIPSHASARFLNIHGYYHGGETLRSLVEEVMEDVSRRAQRFPTWDSLHLPVRSGSDGKYLSSGHGLSLIQTALESLFIHRVDWLSTIESVLTSISSSAKNEQSLPHRIVALGPNTRSILHATRAVDFAKVEIYDTILSTSDGPYPNDIAIVGLSVNYPSGGTPEELWAALSKSLNAVQEIPSNRFDINAYHSDRSATSSRSRHMETQHGNFIDHPFDFDNKFFNISAREATSMDPQHRILLHGATEALADAGYVPHSSPTFQPETAGVFIGASTGDYVDNTRDSIDVYYSPGTLRAFLSGRISYAFQFKGPSVVIDTACSSSMVACHQACRALQAGDCTMAVAGGVNVISSPDMYLGLSRAHFLSPTGQCKPFDSLADGYCRSEGCGLFVLKRLSDAEAEGDHIYGIIRGIEMNQCGTAKSITHPDHETQAELFSRLLINSRCHADSISVIEAHGTGTQAGDFAEMQSIQSVFGRSRTSDQPLMVSSIKGNIGHTEAASGAAALAKLLLMLRNNQIPPQASFTSLNPRLSSITEHHILVPRTLDRWHVSTTSPRRAMLNNFGAAGSNAALLLEEFRDSPVRTLGKDLPARSMHLLNISAKSGVAFKQLCEAYCTYVDKHSEAITLVDLCTSINSRRQHYDAFRASITGTSVKDILDKLRKIEVPEKSLSASVHPVVFVFSGQGSIYRGMGSELITTAPVFQEAISQCNDILSSMRFGPMNEFFAQENTNDDRPSIGKDVVLSQCACFVVEYALAQLWISWGVIPDVVVGHSLGEYAALAIAGVLTLRDALLLVSQRAALMEHLCEAGSSGMAACNIAASKLEALLTNDLKDMTGLNIACINSMNDCVVAGPLAALEKFINRARDLGHKVKKLDVPFAFHSATMDPILDKLTEVAQSVTLGQPTIPIVSSLLGRVLTGDDLRPEYFTEHARQSVEFSNAIFSVTDLIGTDKVTFLEVGPHPITLPMVRANCGALDARYLPSLKSNVSAWDTLTVTLRSLYLGCYPIRWREVYNGSGGRYLHEIPHHPFLPSTFLVPFTECHQGRSLDAESNRNSKSQYSFLDSRRRHSKNGLVTFETNVSAIADFIKAHVVGGVPLCPASVYIELALEGIFLEKSELQGGHIIISNMAFETALVYTEDSDRKITLVLDTKRTSFEILSNGNESHCTGSWNFAEIAVLEDIALRDMAYIQRQRRTISIVDTFSARMLYELVFPRVVSYSEPYLTIKSLGISSNGLEGFGIFNLPAASQGQFVVSPAFVDTMLHAAGFIANSKISCADACICVRVGSVSIPGKDDNVWSREGLQVYCSLVECANDYLIGDAYALDASDNVVASVKGMRFKRLRLEAFRIHLSRLKASAEAPPTAQKLCSMSLDRGDRNKAGIKANKARARTPRNHEVKAESQVPLRSRLEDKISVICATEGPIDCEVDLSELGIDSLLSIEMVHELQSEFADLRLSTSDFARCSTLGDIERLINSAVATIQSPDLTPGSTSSPSGEASPILTPQGADCSFPHLYMLLENICGISIEDFDKDSSLEQLGVDSLLSIELNHALQERLGLTVGENLPSLKIDELEERLMKKASATPMPEPAHESATRAVPSCSESRPLGRSNDFHAFSHAKQHLLTKVQDSSSDRRPLYLIHDGSGMSDVYARISDLGRSVFSISSVDFGRSDVRDRSMEQLAAFYVQEITSVERTGRGIILGGWSFGGVLAFEIARQCQDNFINVEGIILIDSPPPVNHQPLPEAVISHICGTFLGDKPSIRNIRADIEAQFRLNTATLCGYKPLPALCSIPCISLQCSEVFDTDNICGVSYPWLSNREYRDTTFKIWDDLAGMRAPVLEVNGNHFNLFSKSHINSVSLQLDKACQMIEERVV